MRDGLLSEPRDLLWPATESARHGFHLVSPRFQVLQPCLPRATTRAIFHSMITNFLTLDSRSYPRVAKVATLAHGLTKLTLHSLPSSRYPLKYCKRSLLVVFLNHPLPEASLISLNDKFIHQAPHPCYCAKSASYGDNVPFLFQISGHR